MKNTLAGGFKNRIALTIIEITVIETYVMVKCHKIIFGIKFDQLRHLFNYKKCIFCLSDVSCYH